MPLEKQSESAFAVLCTMARRQPNGRECSNQGDEQTDEIERENEILHKEKTEKTKQKIAGYDDEGCKEDRLPRGCCELRCGRRIPAPREGEAEDDERSPTPFPSSETKDRKPLDARRRSNFAEIPSACPSCPYHPKEEGRMQKKRSKLEEERKNAKKEIKARRGKEECKGRDQSQNRKGRM
jgi:hypothetical protein